MNYKIIKSRTFWVAVLLGLYNALTVWSADMPNVRLINDVVNGLGLLLITYFHVNPSQQYKDPKN